MWHQLLEERIKGVRKNYAMTKIYPDTFFEPFGEIPPRVLSESRNFVV